jgi:hypothetical protein
LRPGKHNYVVIQDDDEPLANNPSENVMLPDDDSVYYIHKNIVENRDEEVVHFAKPTKSIKRERYFVHATSVFKDWKPDIS